MIYYRQNIAAPYNQICTYPIFNSPQRTTAIILFVNAMYTHQQTKSYLLH